MRTNACNNEDQCVGNACTNEDQCVGNANSSRIVIGIVITMLIVVEILHCCCEASRCEVAASEVAASSQQPAGVRYQPVRFAAISVEAPRIEAWGSFLFASEVRAVCNGAD